MEKRQLFFIITLLLCITTKSHAQWESPFSHYWEIKGYYNPSFAGETDNVRSAALYHLLQKNLNNATFKDSPQRIAITIDMPFEFRQRKHGAGIVAFTESAGALRNSLLAVQYSFKQELGGGILNIGLQGGIYNLNYEAGNHINPSIKSIVNITEKQVADLSTGISWASNRFYAGLSLMHVNQPGFYINTNILETDSNRSYIPRTYNFIAGYNIRLFNSLEIQPMVWLLHDEYKTQAQATIRLEHNKRFSGGFSLITDNGYSISAGANIKGFRFGYAYTTYNKNIKEASNQNHELFINYDIPLNSFKPKIQPHKSIRFL